VYQTDDNFCIKVIRDLDGFRKLKDTWNNLTQGHGSYRPWLSWDWFSLLLKYFMENRRLFILLVYKSGEIAAIAPLAIAERKYKGLLKARIVQFISNMYSPVNSLIFSDSCIDSQRAIVERINRYFCEEYADWDVLDFGKMPEENYSFGLFTEAISAAPLKYRSYFCNGDWYLDEITYSFSEYSKKLPRIHRKDTNRNKRHLKEAGDLTFHLKNDSENLDKYLDLYSEVRNRSWKAEERDSIFLREVAELFAGKGWLRLAFLFFNGVPIACDKCLVWDKTLYFWDGVYDLEFSKYSPGKVLGAEILAYMIDQERISLIDFGEGDEFYKTRWTPRRRERKGVTVFNRNIRGAILAFLMINVLPYFQRRPYLIPLKKRISRFLRSNEKNNDNINI
jgi:CelD/BcsL family acetyltransferase involved in cellulose biosynthesis